MKKHNETSASESKIKLFLFSENGMKAVNALFFLSLFVRNRGIIFAAYTLWIVYLVYSIKNSSSNVMKNLYKAFVVFAATMILVNVYFMLKAFE